MMKRSGVFGFLFELCLVGAAISFSPQVSFRLTTALQRLHQSKILNHDAINDISDVSSSIDHLPSNWCIVPAAATTVVFGITENALADGLVQLSGLTPATFQPVCPASDGVYRFLQSATVSVVGRENFVEYGPLIAGGLLRVRLELCVVESFFNEAVGPFIEQNGVSWVLPLHETVETFLAGTIFALASTFILVGSTKLVTVLVTYTDVFIGFPCRLLGGFAFDRARGKPITFDVGLGPFQARLLGPPKDQEEEELTGFELGKTDNPVELISTIASGGFKALGEASKLLREVMEGLDLFVGRYLVLIATGYIGLKFLHFKVFPDFP